MPVGRERDTLPGSEGNIQHIYSDKAFARRESLLATGRIDIESP